MEIGVEGVEFRTRWMRTRFPFRYGIAAMIDVPHVFVQAKLSIDGAAATGVSADHLAPKWFTKDPGTTFDEDLPGFAAALESAAGLARGTRSATVFDAWHRLYVAQDEWARDAGVPPLLAHFGTSLVERAMIDAFCRGAETSFAEAVREDLLGIDLGRVHEELGASRPADWLPDARSRVRARHTVGLSDPLEAADIEDPVDDGLPQDLVAVIRRYGHTHFKIKVCGDLEKDLDRLRQLARLLAREAPDYVFTLDGNEQFRSLSTFREHWTCYAQDADIAGMFERLLFVEQALHRDVALADDVEQALADWPDGPPMIIDESDASLGSFRRAVGLGYRGTSHKNCKGVFKGIANRCYLAWLEQQNPGRWVMSGEDLTNVGPVALTQDLAVMATLGIEHVERNGHHYFAGLDMFPDEVSTHVLARHPALYRDDAGRVTLRIEAGEIDLADVVSAPFGHALDIEPMLESLGAPGLPNGAPSA